MSAKKWLSQHGLSAEEHLACGRALPQKNEDLISILENSTNTVLNQSSYKKRIYHGCSGKHCCQLAFCIYNDWDINGYFEPGHPAQQALFSKLEHLSERPLEKIAKDGCNLPARRKTPPELRLSAQVTASRRHRRGKVLPPVAIRRRYLQCNIHFDHWRRF